MIQIMKRKDPPTAEEVITKLKDNGDFDALRLKVVCRVKDNEDLRKKIVTEVKQSIILNADGSENLKPRQLSDAVYQELGSKIMGQISDEVWKVIRSHDNIRDDIKGTVETVYRRLVNPEEGKGDQVRSSPAKEQPISRKEDDAPQRVVSMCEPIVPDATEPNEPPGFSNNIKVEHEESVRDDPPCLPSKEKICRPPDVSHPSYAMSSDFGGGVHSNEVEGDVSDDDSDVPPGFG